MPQSRLKDHPEIQALLQTASLNAKNGASWPALENYEQALEIASDRQLISVMSTIQERLGDFWLSRRKREYATHHLREALRLHELDGKSRRKDNLLGRYPWLEDQAGREHSPGQVWDVFGVFGRLLRSDNREEWYMLSVKAVSLVLPKARVRILLQSPTGMDLLADSANSDQAEPIPDIHADSAKRLGICLKAILKVLLEEKPIEASDPDPFWSDLGCPEQEMEKSLLIQPCKVDAERSLLLYITHPQPGGMSSGTRETMELLVEVLKKSYATIFRDAPLDDQPQTAVLEKLAVESAPDMIIWIDRSDRILYANDQACEVLGFSRQELLEAHSLEELVTEVQDYPAENFWEDLKNAGALSYESTIITRLGKRIQLDVNVFFRKIQDRELACFYLRDVTSYREGESELRFREEFENIINVLGIKFINLQPGGLKAAIDEMLARIGLFIGAERGLITEISEDGEHIVVTHRWLRKKVSVLYKIGEEVPTDRFPGFKNLLEYKQAILILPDDPTPEGSKLRAFLSALPWSSFLLIMPFVAGGRQYLVWFQSQTLQHPYLRSVLGEFKLVAEVIANGIERNRDDQKLRESHRKYQALLDHLPAMAFRIQNKEGWPFEFVSKQCKKLVGLTPAELMAKPQAYLVLIHPDDRTRLIQTWQKALARGESYHISYRIVREQNAKSTSWVYEQGTGIVDKSGLPIAIEGVAFDQTDSYLRQQELADKHAAVNEANEQLIQAKEGLEERVESQLKALREKDVLLNHIINHSGSLIFVKDLDGRYILVNDYWCEIFGLSRDKALGRTDYDIYPEEDASQYIANDREVIRSGELQESEEYALDNEGMQRVYLSMKFPIFNEEGELIATGGISTEITKQKEAEQREKNRNIRLSSAISKLQDTREQLIRTEKLASLGQLTAGIAHEINNPVNFVYAGANSLKKYFESLLEVVDQYDELDPGQAPAQKLSDIAKLKEALHYVEVKQTIPDLISDIQLGASRIRDIVKGLSTFSRVKEDTMQPTDINENLDSALLLLSNKHKDRIRIVRDYDAELPRIPTQAGKLNQVFVNLLANAMDAIEGEGSIVIRTHVQDDEVLIGIRDSGKGIPDDVRSKIFDPFFTTKDVGEGTGLGLSISYSIIQDHGGSIELKTDGGAGTKFVIHLPIRQEPKN